MDIVEHLRACREMRDLGNGNVIDEPDDIANAAADEIVRLRRELGETQAEVVQRQDELGRLLHAAEGENERLRAAQEWQDISTAPKDRDILITGRYANGRAYVESSCWDYRGHFTARKFEPPTHWMPMPQPHGGWDVAIIAEERGT